MRIGLDFDNTIVSYDTLFHKIARERDLVPSNISINKVAVRDYLRRIGQEEAWTEMQGYVYGARMNEAITYPGVVEFMRWASQTGHELFIVSHKTKHPFLGVQYDLHAAARSWIEKHLDEKGLSLIPANQIFFELTKEQKLARIGECRCDIFLDDLPEILQASAFPETTRPILFDPENHHAALALHKLTIIQKWDDFAQSLDS